MIYNRNEIIGKRYQTVHCGHTHPVLAFEKPKKGAYEGLIFQDKAMATMRLESGFGLIEQIGHFST